MRIAFVSQPWNYCPPIRGGSIAIWTHEIARRLAKAADVTVYAAAGLQPDEEIVEGVRYRRVSNQVDERAIRRLKQLHRRLSIRTPLHSRTIYYLGYILQVARDLRAHGCDVVHVFNFSQFVPLVRLLNPDARIVLNMRCEWLTQLDHYTVSRRLAKTDLVVGCSEHITDTIRSAFPEYAARCVTVPNGVDIDVFSPGTAGEQGCAAGSKRMVFVGRISPEKGLHVLIDALPRVLAECPEATLEIVGREEVTPADFIVSLTRDDRVSNLISFYNGTSYLARLQQRVRELGVTHAVTFSGYVPHADLPAHLRSADVLVNPSFTESFGRSLIEAMSCGVPVAASRAGGMTEILDEGKYGLLVEPGDAVALGEAISTVLSNGELRTRMCQAAREWVLERYAWDVVADLLRREYEAIPHHGS